MPRKADNRRKERRNRWIRWAIALLLAGAAGAYAFDKRAENLELVQDAAADSVVLAGLEDAAAVAVVTILELETRLVELMARPPETVIQYVDRPVADSARILELDSTIAELEAREPPACPVCAAIDSTRILEFAVIVADLEADVEELRNQPPPDPIEIRVVEVRRNWWEYVIVAGVAGVGGYLIGDSGGESSSSKEKKEKCDRDSEWCS